MTAGGVRNLKHKELYGRYKEQSEPKCKRAKFVSRVKLYGYTKEKALSLEVLYKAKRNQHIVRDENGRVCNTCKQYKPRDEYSKHKAGFHGKNSSCKECKNKQHREYREKNGHSKDKEYREKTRKLNNGDQVYFHSEIREVIGYTPRKGYEVQSIMSGEKRRIDTGDNKISTTTNCVKFTKLSNKVELVSDEEEKPKFELNITPDEEDEEYFF